jgi:hypothetical protein
MGRPSFGAGRLYTNPRVPWPLRSFLVRGPGAQDLVDLFTRPGIPKTPLRGGRGTRTYRTPSSSTPHPPVIGARRVGPPCQAPRLAAPRATPPDSFPPQLIPSGLALAARFLAPGSKARWFGPWGSGIAVRGRGSEASGLARGDRAARLARGGARPGAGGPRHGVRGPAMRGAGGIRCGGHGSRPGGFGAGAVVAVGGSGAFPAGLAAWPYTPPV